MPDAITPLKQSDPIGLIRLSQFRLPDSFFKENTGACEIATIDGKIKNKLLNDLEKHNANNVAADFKTISDSHCWPCVLLY